MTGNSAHFAISFRSDLYLSFRTDVAIGHSLNGDVNVVTNLQKKKEQTSISSVELLFVTLNPIFNHEGCSPSLASSFFAYFGGRSKWGVILVR